LALLLRTGGRSDSTILCSEIIVKRAKQAYKIKTLYKESGFASINGEIKTIRHETDAGTIIKPSDQI
jgi:hypothetical protein